MRAIIKKGFTFIELSLAILFVSLLALTVALVTSNISHIYAKGLTIKAVNSTGSDLIEEITVGLQSAPATQLSAICETVFEYKHSNYYACVNDQSYKFIYHEYAANVKVAATGDIRNNAQLSGVFCTGKYSYVWNTGYVNNELYTNTAGTANIPSATLKYQVTGEEETSVTDFRLLRFEDPSRVACGAKLSVYGQGPVNNRYASNDIDNTYDVTKESNGLSYTIPSKPVELIPATENPLSLYGFYVAPPAQDSTTNRLFYSGSFILATIRGGVDITADHDFCEVNPELNEDFDYCAINKFNFAAQATGK